MSTRLSSAGSWIDRNVPISFDFNGTTYQGFSGDTLASALLANGQQLVGRSFKYHRPRGILSCGPEEPNALVDLGRGQRAEPNQRATVSNLHQGLVAHSQNHWPSLAFDIGAINARLSKFLPAGFYYKTFMKPRAAWSHFFEPIIRRSAGLGVAPQKADQDNYEHFYVYVDILVVGGGLAGLVAAYEAGKAGAQVLLCEQSAHFGGRSLVDQELVDGLPVADWVTAKVAELAEMPNVQMVSRTTGTGVYDHGYVLAHQRISDHLADPGCLRHRLCRIRAKRVITATGAIERPLSFAGNDIPGVMLASAVRDYVMLYGVSPGARTVIVTNNDDAYRGAIALHAAGLVVPVILDARPEVTGGLPEQARALGIRVETGSAIAQVRGGKNVKSVDICAQAGDGTVLESIACDCVAMSGGWSPVVHLWSHCGGKLNWDDGAAMFRPDLTRPPTGADGAGFVLPAGAANGYLLIADGLSDAQAMAHQALRELDFSVANTAPSKVDATPEMPILPVWMMPQNAGIKLRSKAFVDFQNDVKVSDIQLAAREGFESVEHAKRYTTLGMATDQGKLSNINGLAVLADSLNRPVPDVGTTTFRPPYTPVTMGAIAGEATGDLFKPLRKTSIDSWHSSNGAKWEPVADWRRPYVFLQAGETTKTVLSREVLNTRSNVGILDASTLGKILVKGPDAGRFLDLVYTNMMSTLPEGRCRYGLMCTENGFLFDDGVVARLSADSFLCHTTTGNADRVHAWLEEWLQTEWWDFDVYTVNQTEQFAQITLAGPKARDVLTDIGGMELSAEKVPFMGWVEGELGGIKARVYRISFSGELSFEIAVPATQGAEFWDRCLQAGAKHGIQPYGTEALHVLRAEKGFIMIGDETDGTVTPQDLNLGWAVSKKKTDFIGKRAQARSFLTTKDRKTLVGLLSEVPQTVLPSGAYAVEGGLRRDGTASTIGHVTSSYYSPTLKRAIAMGLIKGGADRLGEVLDFAVEGQIIKAKVVDPVFYDKEGARQNV